MIRPCRCPPRLAGRRRTTGSLRDSDEGPGAAGAGAVSRRARPCNGQGSRCRKRHFTLLEWLAREFRKIFFPKIPAVARYHSQRPESHSDAMTRHSGPARAARGTYCDPSHHAQRPARLTRPGPSHSQQPAVHHSPQPASLAAARVTRSGPPSPAAARRHRPRAVTVVTRRALLSSLAAARQGLNRRGPVTRRGPSHSDGAAARLCSPQPASLTQ